MFEAIGLTVSRLMRVRYGPFELPRRLARGKSEELKAEQVEKLLSVVPAKGKQRKGPAEEARPPVDGETPTSPPKRGRRRGPRKPREAGEGGNRAAPQQGAPSPQGGEGVAPARKRAPRRRRRSSAKPAAGGGEA